MMNRGFFILRSRRPECIHTGTVATPATEGKGIALFPFPFLVSPSGQKISRASADLEYSSLKIGALNLLVYFLYENPLFHRQLPDSKKKTEFFKRREGSIP